MSRDVVTTDSAIEKLLKAMPAEITGAYLAIRSIASTEDNSNDLQLFGFAVLILLISPIFMRFVLGMKRWGLIFFLMLSFVVWVANIDLQRIVTNEDSILELAGNQGEYIEIVASFIVKPFIVKATLVIWAILLLPIVLAKSNPETNED